MKELAPMFLKYVLPIAVAALSTVLSEKWFALSTWLNKQSAPIKRLVVAGIVFVLYAISVKIGVQLVPADVLANMPDDLPSSVDFGAGLSGMLTYLFHLSDRQKSDRNPPPPEIDAGA